MRKKFTKSRPDNVSIECPTDLEWLFNLTNRGPYSFVLIFRKSTQICVGSSQYLCRCYLQYLLMSFHTSLTIKTFGELVFWVEKALHRTLLLILLTCMMASSQKWYIIASTLRLWKQQTIQLIAYFKRNTCSKHYDVVILVQFNILVERGFIIFTHVSSTPGCNAAVNKLLK